MKIEECYEIVDVYRLLAMSIPASLSSFHRYMYECPVRYKPSKDERLRDQLVPKEGALSHVEGLVLYALVRAINAKDILELGTFAGHSTNYLVEAAEQTGGLVVSVDLVRYWGRVFRCQAWSWLSHVRACFVKSDAITYLRKLPDDSLDFIFEDTSHSFLDTRSIIHHAQGKLRSGGILAIHDVAVTGVESCKVKEAVEDSGLPFLCFTVYPGLQGLALWRKP